MCVVCVCVCVCVRVCECVCVQVCIIIKIGKNCGEFIERFQVDVCNKKVMLLQTPTQMASIAWWWMFVTKRLCCYRQLHRWHW